MKHKKLFAIICTLSLITSSIAALTTFAAEQEENEEKYSEFITSYSLSIASGSKKVYLTAETFANDYMAKIGFTNIVVQHSVNGTSGWSDEVPRDNDLAANSYYHFKTYEPITVSGGYYYRVVLDHYAKETGWFFPGSQSLSNYSNVVWVS